MSLSFDRATTFYDQSRTLPEPVAVHGLQAILDLIGPGKQILDVGTGSGRVSVPLMERGADIIGCDLSLNMMQLQRAKHPAARLAQASATHLPFATHQFPALLTIHVLHVVSGWQAALDEFKRVLQPGGLYINSWNWHHDQTPAVQMRRYWRSRVEALGGSWQRPGIQSREELLAALTALGAQVEELEVVRFTTPMFLEQEFNDLAQRKYSDSWNVPDAIFTQAIADTRQWLDQNFPDLAAERREERRFILDIARF